MKKTIITITVLALLLLGGACSNELDNSFEMSQEEAEKKVYDDTLKKEFGLALSRLLSESMETRSIITIVR